MTPFQEAAVEEKFKSYPAAVRDEMLALRELVFLTVQQTPGLGEVQETLKWGEPAYVTLNKVGSTFRIDWKAQSPGQYAMYFHCQTNLVETFRQMFPHEFHFEGNRALIFRIGDRLPRDELSLCIGAALTYHVKRPG